MWVKSHSIIGWVVVSNQMMAACSNLASLLNNLASLGMKLASLSMKLASLGIKLASLGMKLASLGTKLASLGIKSAHLIIYTTIHHLKTLSSFFSDASGKRLFISRGRLSLHLH